MKLEDVVMYAIRNKETGAMWGDPYSNKTGAKTSWYHASRYYDQPNRRYVCIRFDDQDKYEIVKVKFVVVDE
jgi:hypothetical protein